MGVTILGRYALFDQLAMGGMGSVHLARLQGQAGFGRTVAVKLLHPHYAGDAVLVSMMLEEARLASRVHHPNVVPILDVVQEGQLALVLEYVHGETLANLARLAARSASPKVPEPVVRAVIIDVLRGLHAAHEAKDESGVPLGIIHRDVSPQNVIVGADGHTRVLDFGIAKARLSSLHSEQGELKGKVPYMAPEQLFGKPLDRRTDVFGASVVAWELATGDRLYGQSDNARITFMLMTGAVRSPRTVRADLDSDLEEVVMKGLEHEPSARYATAGAMADALERTGRVASAKEVSDWVASLARETLAQRAELVLRVEKATAVSVDMKAVASQLAAASTPVTKTQPPLPVDATAVMSPLTRPSSPSPPPPRRRAPLGPAIVGVALLASALGLAFAVVARKGVHAAPRPAVSAVSVAAEAPAHVDAPALAPPSAAVDRPAPAVLLTGSSVSVVPPPPRGPTAAGKPRPTPPRSSPTHGTGLFNRD